MTINIEELRRLTQEASPGPWTAKNTSGVGLEIHMSHPLYPDKFWPAFGTDSAFCKKGLVSYETWTQFPHEVRDAQQSKNALFIAAANPAAVSELLDRLEEAEAECLEQARLNGMGASREAALMAKLEAAENDSTHQKAIAESALRVAEGWERKCGELRAKIEAMEKQEPVYLFRRKGLDDFCTCSKERYESLSAKPRLFEVKTLYAIPGVQGEWK